MTVACPACGTQFDSGGFAPGSVATCPACDRPFRLDMPVEPAVGEEGAQTEQSPAGTVICPICKTSNPPEAKVCGRCAAILRRKHWPGVESPASSGTAGRFPVRRRHLTFVVACLLGVAVVAMVAWMTASLFKGIETPSLAYRRMAGMASNGDWGRFYDRLAPRTQAGMIATAQSSGRLGTRTGREWFVTEGLGPAFMAIHGLPVRGFTITGEEVRGDCAVLDVKLSSGGRAIVSMVKDAGIWKLSAEP
jgi:ribosomal protein L40E